MRCCVPRSVVIGCCCFAVVMVPCRFRVHGRSSYVCVCVCVSPVAPLSAAARSGPRFGFPQNRHHVRSSRHVRIERKRSNNARALDLLLMNQGAQGCYSRLRRGGSPLGCSSFGRSLHVKGVNAVQALPRRSPLPSAFSPPLLPG